MKSAQQTPATTSPTHIGVTPGSCRGSSRGMSLVELLCSVAIMAILLGGVLPMFIELRASQALQATAALLETDLQYARSLATLGGGTVRLSTQALASGGSCYAVHTGPAQACRCSGDGQARCDAGATLLRLADQGGPSGITLGPVARSILFDGGKGTVTPHRHFSGGRPRRPRDPPDHQHHGPGAVMRTERQAGRAAGLLKRCRTHRCRPHPPDCGGSRQTVPRPASAVGNRRAPTRLLAIIHT